MKTQECEDYLHIWRYIGYLMGVDDVLGAARTPERADACLESIVLRLTDPGHENGRMCATLLKNMAPKLISPVKIINAIGLPDPFRIHMALAEHLLVPTFWEESRLPRMTTPYRLAKQMILNFMLFGLWLVKESPWWFQLRSPFICKTQMMRIAKEIGKRTQFELKEVPQDGGKAFDCQLMGGPVKDEYGARGSYWPKILTAAFVAIGLTMVLSQ